MSHSLKSGARLPGAVGWSLFQFLAAFAPVPPSTDRRRKTRNSTPRTKLLSAIVAVATVSCALATGANAQKATSSAKAPGAFDSNLFSWLPGASYNPSNKATASYLPAESGVNFTLAPFAGYVNLGSGTSGQEFSGSSGSVAFPVGQSFGLYTNFTAASLGRNGVYDLGSNFYWRAPNTGLIGALGDIGEFAGSNGFKYSMGAANAEGYFGRVTLFAAAGAFRLQGLSTYGLGTVGAAYYPTDNLQLSLGGYDFGGISGAQAGAEYLLPKLPGSTVAVTVGADGYVGNHGTSGAMARLRFLTGLNGPNNKTLIERRREDDPVSDSSLLDGQIEALMGSSQNNHSRGINAPQGPAICLPNSSVCTNNAQCCSGHCIVGGPFGGQCS
jgi:hypothetical protein